jgi:uncharacterized RDD family membrane protein YckC
VVVGDDDFMSDATQSPFDDQEANLPPPGSPPPPPPSRSFGHQPPPGYVPYAEHQTGVGREALASPTKRIIARILDGLIVGVVFFILAAGFGGGFVLGGLRSSDALGFQVLGLLVGITYEATFLATRGATPGKMIMSIKVVFEDQRTLDLPGALMRLSPNIVLGVIALVPAFVTLSNLANVSITIVSLVFLFTHERRQTVWDRIAKTIVVDA